MFYPLKSITFTWEISKKICLIFRSFSLFLQVLIGSLLATSLSTISVQFSIGWGVLSVLFLWITLIDVMDRMIPDILSLSVLLTVLSLGLQFQLAGCVSITIMLTFKVLAEYLYKKTLLGWGDIKLISVFLMVVPLSHLPIFLFTMGCVGLLISILTCSKAIPFAPSIIGGFILVLICL